MGAEIDRGWKAAKGPAQAGPLSFLAVLPQGSLPGVTSFVVVA